MRKFPLFQVLLYSVASNIQELRDVTNSEKKEFIFRPNESSYKSLDIQFINEVRTPFKYRNVFIGCDSLNIIQKIVLFVEGNIEEITQFFDDNFQVKHLGWKSYMDRKLSRSSHIWHTKNETTVSASDLSDLYHSELVMIEFVDNSCPESVLLYSINILLGSSFESIKQFVIPFDQSSLKDSMYVTPEKDVWFIYDDMPYVCKGMPGVKINHVLIAVSKEKIIKKIKLYLNDEKSQLNDFLKGRFGDTLIGGKSSLNNNQHFIWHTSKDVLLYFLTTKEPYYFPVGSNAELIFSFATDASEFSKYLVRPRFK